MGAIPLSKIVTLELQKQCQVQWCHSHWQNSTKNLDLTFILSFGQLCTISCCHSCVARCQQKQHKEGWVYLGSVSRYIVWWQRRRDGREIGAGHTASSQGAGRDECPRSACFPLFTKTPDSQSGWAFPPPLELSGHTLADVHRSLAPLVILQPPRT